MKKIFIYFSVCVLFLSCKKDPKSFNDYIKFDKLSVVKTPYQLSSGYYIAKINYENAIFGNTDVNQIGERFYTSDNFSTTLINKEVLSNSSIINYTNIYDDGNTSFLFINNHTSLSYVYKSNDHGFEFSNYVTITQPYSDDACAPSFINSNIGFYAMNVYCSSCSHNAIELHKIENQQDVIVSTTPIIIDPNFRVKTVHFFNENIGWIIMQENNANGSYSIRKTIDGGLTWSASGGLSSNVYISLNKNIRALNDHVLVSKNNNSIYISNNSGQTWKFIDMYELNFKGQVVDLQFLNEDICYAATTSEVQAPNKYSFGYLYKSIDGGDSWAKVSSQYIYGGRLYFLNENVGLVTASSGIIQKTTDGGKTFELLMYPIK